MLVGDVRLGTAVSAHEGVEVYSVSTEDEIEMALLNDLHSPCKLVFIGGERAKRFAEQYGATCIESTPTLEENLLRFWAEGI